MGFHGSLSINTFDREPFPRKGMSLYVEAQKITSVFLSDEETMFNDPCEQLTAEISSIDNLYRNLYVVSNMYFGLVNGDDIHPVHYIYLGGRNRRHVRLIPFDGINYMQSGGKCVGAFEAGVRFDMTRDQFITLRGSIGNTGDTIEDLYNDSTLFFGSGLSYALNSLLGPVEFTLMWSSKENARYTFFNLGYWF